MPPRRNILASVSLFILANLMVASPIFAKPPVYHVTDLGTFDGGIGGRNSGDESYGYGINASGQVTGSSVITSNSLYARHAFRTSATGTIGDPGTDLGTLASSHYNAPSSEGYGINASGQVAGWTVAASSNIHAFRSAATNTLIDLGVFGNGGDSYGTAINSSGQVTGYSERVLNGSYYAFRTTATGTLSDGTATDLGTFVVGGDSFGYGINRTGQITGNAQVSGFNNLGSGREHAFRTTATGTLDDGTATDLGTLGGSDSYGRAINDSGQVTGYSEITGNDSIVHAFRSSATGNTLTDLGVLPGGSTSYGYGINAAGIVVGKADVPYNGDHAIYYDTAMYDLNDYLDSSGAGWALIRAYSINDKGQICGWGINPQGVIHAFLLTPPFYISTHDASATDPYTSPNIAPIIPPSIWQYNGWGVNPIKIWGRQRLLLQIHGSPGDKIRVWVEPVPHSGGHNHQDNARNDNKRP